MMDPEKRVSSPQSAEREARVFVLANYLIGDKNEAQLIDLCGRAERFADHCEAQRSK
jgi:hypothetical protein